MMKKNIKNMAMLGGGLLVGSAVAGKLGGSPEVQGNVQGAFGIASMALPIGAAAGVMNMSSKMLGGMSNERKIRIKRNKKKR
jgi:hypothetical protein